MGSSTVSRPEVADRAVSALLSSPLLDSSAAGTGAFAQQSRGYSSVPNAAFFDIYNTQRQIVPLNHLVPDVAVDAYVAPNAVLVGGVTVEDGASVWYGAVLRADLNYITVGAGSSIQDRTVIHAVSPSPDGLNNETRIGRQVTVGPSSVLTSCEIEDEVIIGQRCIVLEGAIVEKNAILADGTVVAANQLIPSGQLWAGNPAVFVRELSADEKAEIPKVALASKYSAEEHKEEFLPFTSAYINKEKLVESLAAASKAKAKKQVEK